MVKFIEAEFEVAHPTGKKPLTALKIQKLYDNAIAIARRQELKHVEALCLERASMQFEAVDSIGLSAGYMSNAHQCYLQWNAIAKVAEIEEKHATKLEISREQKTVGAGYVQQNSDLRFDPEQRIGGRPDKVRSINLKDAVKTAGKVKGFMLRKSSRKLDSDIESYNSSFSGGSSFRNKFPRMPSVKLRGKSQTK